MKKLLSALLVFMMLLTMVPAGALAVSAATSGTTGDCTWELDDNGHLTISGNGAMGDYSSGGYTNLAPWGGLIISVTIEDGVTTVGTAAFYRCENLVSASIPNSVTTIKSRAFYLCKSLTSITIPDKVTSIGGSAFSSCISLTSIIIPDSVITIGDSAFDSCVGLTSVTIPDSVTSIGESAFHFCTRLTSVTIGAGVTTIGLTPFGNCDKLATIVVSDNNSSLCTVDGVLFSKDMTKLLLCSNAKSGDYVVPNSVTAIEAKAFYGLDNITSITIPDSVTDIGSEAFYACSGLTMVDIGDGITAIEERMFAACANLTTVTIGDGVTTIGKEAFADCEYLKSVTIGNSVRTIGEDAFNSCSRLTSVIMGSSVTMIGASAFASCYNLPSIAIPDSVTTIGTGAFAGCDRLTSIVLGNSVTAIERSAFEECDDLTSVVIPASVTSIDIRAFAFCDNLTTIRINENNADYCAIDNVIFSKDKTTLVLFPGGKVGGYTIPDGTTQIAPYAFYGCENPTAMVIPNSVTTISEYAFANCDGLTSVTIPDSVTMVEKYAFFGCNSLTSISFPNSIATIPVYVLGECDNLMTIHIPSSVTTIENFAFRGCDKLETVVLPDSITSIGKEVFAYSDRLTTMIIPSGVTKIEESMFYNCPKLTVVTIPDSVTHIYRYAFGYCNKLTDVYYSGSEEQWNNVYINTSGNDRLFKATIHCNYSIPESGFINGDFELGSTYGWFKSIPEFSKPVVNSTAAYAGNYGLALTEKNVIAQAIKTEPGKKYMVSFWVKSIGQGQVRVYVHETENVLDDIASNAVYTTTYLFEGAVEWFECSYIDFTAKDTVAYVTIMGETGASFYFDDFVLTSPDDPAGDDAPNEDEGNIPKSEHVIKVVNSSGLPIWHATVNITKSGVTTEHSVDDNGCVKFDKKSVGNVDFSVSAYGYEDYTTVGKNFTLSSSGADVVILYTPEEAAYVLNEAIYQDTDDSYDEVLGIDVNLVKGTKRLSATHQAAGYFRILCSTSDPSKVTKYVLYQGEEEIKSSTDGVFNLRIADFSIGKNIYVTVLGENGMRVSTALNLEICDDSKVKDASLSFGDKVTLALPDSIPLIGGTTIAYDIPNLPIQFVIEEGKIYAGLNVQWEYDKESGKIKEKSIKEQYEKLKEAMEAARKLVGTKVGSNIKKDIAPFVKNKDKVTLPVVGDIDITLIGAGELTCSDSGLDELEIQACFIVDASTKTTWQSVFTVPFVFPPVIIPVTATIKVGVEGKADATVSWSFEDQKVNGDCSINIKPYLTAFGGAGVGEYAGVGAYGEAEVDIGIQLFGTSTAHGLKYVDLTGEFGVKGYAGPFSGELALAHGTWHIYTRTDALRRATNPRLSYSSAFDSENYSIDDVSYLNDQSVWLGNWAVNKRRLTGGANGAISIQPLLLNTYRNLQPTIAATASGDAVMVYIGADTGREAQNVATTMYSVYDPGIATWSEPLQVDSNLTADNAPMVYSDGETIRLVYQDASAVYSAALTQEEYLTTQNIVIYKYDSATSKFVHEQTFEANGKQYRTPKLTEVNGVPALVWIEGEDADILGQNGNNKFLYSYYADGAWTASAVLADGINAIPYYAVGAIDGALNVLYATDADNDLGTDADRSLVLLNVNESKTIHEGTASQLAFVKLPSENAEAFVWIADETLYALNASGEAQEVCSIGSPESVTVVGNKILFTAAGDGNSEIYAVVYDEATDAYSTPVQISQQEKYIERLSGVDFNGAELLVMTRKEVTIGENSITDDCEFAWAVLNDQADLKVNSVEYDYNDIEDGENPLYLTVSNQGAAAAGSYTVSVKDADSNVVVEQAFDETFLAGETKDIVLMMPLDNITEIADYTVSIGESAESISDSQTMTIGYADLAVSTESIKVGNQNTLVCTVTNKGLSASSGELLVYDGTEDNTVFTARLENLAPGETKTFVVDLTSESSERIFTCTVQNDAEDYLEANNTETIYFDFSVFALPECPHTYDNACDATCNECGAVREVDAPVGDVISPDVYHSVTEETDTGSGLAFRFEMGIAGVEYTGNRYVSGTGGITLHGNAHTIKRMGAIISNDAAGILDLDHLNAKTVNIEAKYLLDVDETSVAFAVRVINIPDSGKDTNIYARPYYVYECDGQEIVVYGDKTVKTYNNVYYDVEDFENGRIGAWASNGILAVTKDVPIANANGGNYALRFTSTGYSTASKTVIVKEDTTYKVTFSVLSETSGQPIKCVIRDSAGVVVAEKDYAPADSAWGTCSFTFKSDSNDAIDLVFQVQTATGVYYLDNVSVVPTQNGPIGDGGFEDGELDW